MSTSISSFHLPRYQDLPNMGLYLDQTTKYINHFLRPLGCIQLTSSMVSNYVKKGLVPGPVKKQYYAEQIAYLFFVAVAKRVLTMEYITALEEFQKRAYPPQVAYDYFCRELENMLQYTFGLRNEVAQIGVTAGPEKTAFRCLIIAAANIIYLEHSLSPAEEAPTDPE